MNEESTVRLLEAFEAGDTAEILAAIEAGGDVNERLDGHTLVSCAVSVANLEIVRRLLDAGADPNASDYEEEGWFEGTTSLYWAVAAGSLPLAQLLHDYGARTDLFFKDKHSALHDAAENGRSDIVSWLLDNGAGTLLERFDYVGRTPLVCAIMGGHLECVRLLVKAGADVNAVGGDDHPTCNTPLQRAVQGGHLEIVRYLVTRGADPCLQACGMVAPPIDLARGRPEMLELLSRKSKGRLRSVRKR